MRITFVQSESENLAVEYLSSILKSHGHSVHLAFDSKLFNTTVIKNAFWKRLFNIKDILIKEIVLSKPDLVAFSVLTGDYLWAVDMARSIKEQINVPIIFGGIHPTSIPGEVISNEYVDIICIGEGEGPLVELTNSLKSGIDYNIKNLWFKRNGHIIKNEIRPILENLDTLPFPDKEIFYRKIPFYKKIYTTMVGRGCPYGCTYCCNNILKKIYKGKGRYLRYRSVENVMNELNIAKEKYNPRIFSFPDDTFTTNKTWLEKFIVRYKKEINKPFLCYTHTKFLTEEIARLLKYGECFWLNIGIQTASENNRRKLLKRIESNDEIEQAALNCHKAKLKFSIDHIFNIPYEGEDEYIEALKFYNTLRPSVINSFYLRYYPGVEIIEIAKEAGIIDEETVKSINTGRHRITATVNIGGNNQSEFYNKENTYNNFLFLFSALPLIPKRLMAEIIEKKWYNLFSFYPVIFTVLIKFIVRLRIKQCYLYIDEIKRLIYHSLYCLRQKIKTYNFGKIEKSKA